MGRTDKLIIRHTALEMLMTCPFSFEARFIRNIILPPSGAAYFGTCYHHALGQNFKQKERTKKDLLLPDLFEAFHEAWEKKLGSEDPVDEVIWLDETPEFLKDVGFKLLERYITDVAPGVQPQKDGVEKLITRELKSKYIGEFQARLDLIEDKTEKIIDQKTVRRQKAEVEAKRDLQPYSYMFARGKAGTFEWHQAHKTKEKIIILGIERTPQDIDWFEREFLPPIIKQIEKGIFPITPNYRCLSGWCGYISLCRLPENTRVYYI